ncbi:NAD-dependent epimerase/dehydratase [Beutenbergia cavernae DSM 12333]|uniref:NAD-dependent epimerase/dehydratase n=1 Tax=Beutenbergia cavernae (strain ATCC BAA-8 / DSM 12333 / CCUG 43141 / JCM 11478 / NBRC 16432 / NCIMB 13614 / HKI 0122) TaxID=471853 RepID=C5C1I3_BEUC1|nr:NAD(P)-dependent oxidoreductase [Beutenbergia cavernae]ACQ81593.1 NAD-dependent epimerase/dehydratase [Beutenbergia cavernae DSM 12333]
MRTVDELERTLATPSAGLVADLAALEGDILVLGAAGKLGPSLVRLAVNGVEQAGTGARVTAVSRFTTPGSAEQLEAAGAHTVTADLTDETSLAGLPDAANVVFLVGAKFGSDGNEAATWHTNTYLPGRVAERFSGSRISALSTGNVYPLVPVDGGGSREGDAPAPVGEYAMSCLGRERVLEAMARRNGTPTAIIRLNYAVEMRYGVLVDLGQQILAGEPIDVTTGAVNLVWQGYANEVTLRALRHADVPPFVLNVTGAQTLRVRDLALALGERLGRDVELVGSEADTALLSDATASHEEFGEPAIGVEALLDHTAAWLTAGGPVHGKPTKFQRRDGKF